MQAIDRQADCHLEAFCKRKLNKHENNANVLCARLSCHLLQYSLVVKPEIFISFDTEAY